MSRYVQTFKVKDGDKDKKNNLMFFRIDNGRLFGEHKVIWAKIYDLKIIELNGLLLYDGRCIKTKVRTYGDKF